MKEKKGNLTATSLKNALWGTLTAIQSGSILPAQGDAIAGQAREILRTAKVQLSIASQSNRPVPAELITFAEN